MEIINNTAKYALLILAPLILSACKLTVINEGGGTVTSASGTILCGSLCSASYNDSTTEMLTAVPDDGYRFTGWENGCTGTDTCSVTISRTSGNKSVKAVFQNDIPEYVAEMLTLPGSENCAPNTTPLYVEVKHLNNKSEVAGDSSRNSTVFDTNIFYWADAQNCTALGLGEAVFDEKVGGINNNSAILTHGLMFDPRVSMLRKWTTPSNANDLLESRLIPLEWAGSSSVGALPNREMTSLDINDTENAIYNVWDGNETSGSRQWLFWYDKSTDTYTEILEKTYSVTGHNFSSNFPLSINNSNIAVTASTSTTFIIRDGVVTQTVPSFYGRDINDNGLVVGNSCEVFDTDTSVKAEALPEMHTCFKINNQNDVLGYDINSGEVAIGNIDTGTSYLLNQISDVNVKEAIDLNDLGDILVNISGGPGDGNPTLEDPAILRRTNGAE